MQKQEAAKAAKPPRDRELLDFGIFVAVLRAGKGPGACVAVGIVELASRVGIPTVPHY